MNFVDNMPFDQEPPYEVLRHIFEDLLESKHETNDGRFDWVKGGQNAKKGGQKRNYRNAPRADHDDDEKPTRPAKVQKAAPAEKKAKNAKKVAQPKPKRQRDPL